MSARSRSLWGGTGDEGVGTVIVLGACAILVLAALASVLIGQAILVRHRAGAAADLAALAAARAGADNVPAPCRAARVVATRNRAQLSSCRVTGRGDARVSVTVTGAGLAHIQLRGTGFAHAAPTG